MSYLISGIIFTAPIPQHGEIFCKSPTHNTTNLQTESKQSNDYCIAAQSFNEIVLPYNGTIDHNKNLLILSINKSQTANRCESFGYNRDFESIITQFDLVCSREILVAVTQSFHLFGILCGGIVGGFMLKQ